MSPRTSGGPRGHCISATVHEHVRGKLAYPFQNRGEQTLKNIATPVRIYSLGPEIIAWLPRDEARSEIPKKSWRWYAVALAVGCLCTAVLWTLWQYLGPSGETAAIQTRSFGPSSPPIPAPRALLPSAPAQSIVVLPFTSRDPEQEYFAEGITEDLTTDLSRIPGSLVIAPSTAFTYKGRPIDVRQIGRELSVRYALQGSVRRMADSVRINAQLVDAANASQLWADRFNLDPAV